MAGDGIAGDEALSADIRVFLRGASNAGLALLRVEILKPFSLTRRIIGQDDEPLSDQVKYDFLIDGTPKGLV